MSYACSMEPTNHSEASWLDRTDGDVTDDRTNREEDHYGPHDRGSIEILQKPSSIISDKTYGDNTKINIKDFDNMKVNITELDNTKINIEEFDNTKVNITEVDNMKINITEIMSYACNIEPTSQDDTPWLDRMDDDSLTRTIV